MTRRRFLADEVTGDRAALTGAHAAHLSRVLRARAGQEFDLAAAGRVRRARVIGVADDRVDFQLGEDVVAAAVANLTVLLAVFKFDRMEWALEKLTELGIAEIVPVVAQRTDRHLAQAAAKRCERWQRLAAQASEQSRRDAPPKIATPTRISDALAGPWTTRIVLAENEQERELKDELMAADASQPVALAIGPEGGWTDEELAAFRGAGWTFASLGPTILRAETAAIAAAAIALAELRS